MMPITEQVTFFINVPRGNETHKVQCPSYEHAVQAKNIAIWAAQAWWKLDNTMEIIQGIKAIRLLLGCGLLDAKLIMDEAKEMTKPFDHRGDDYAKIDDNGGIAVYLPK